MAIADRATSSANSGTQQTSLSWSHTVATGSNRVLFVFISIDSTGGTGQTYDASATYNGVSMTRIANANDNQYGAAFVLVAPAEGANTVQVSWTGSQYPSGVAISYTGVDQTTPNDTVTIDTSSSGTSFSNAITSATGDMVLAFYTVNNNTTPLTATGSGTARVETGSSPLTSAGVSDASGASSVTTGWSWPSANRYSGVSFNVNAASAGAYTLTAEHGTINLTGQAVGLTAARKMVPEHGAIALTGQDVSLPVARKMVPEHGAIALTGQDVGLTHGYNLIAEHGAIALTGQDVDLTTDATGEVLRGRQRGRRRRLWREIIDDAPEAMLPVVTAAEALSGSDYVRDVVEDAISRYRIAEARGTIERQERVLRQVERAIAAAVQRASEEDDDDAIAVVM